MDQFERSQLGAAGQTFAFNETAQQLHAEPHQLWQWSRRFARFLTVDVDADHPRYTYADLVTLGAIQALTTQGHTDEQITAHLATRQADNIRFSPPVLDPGALAGGAELVAGSNTDVLLPQSLRDVFGTLAGGQRAILNNQATMREMVGVVVQDNFNLKDENRKLRERILELERALAEYQRREELRKERLESRLRALESTVAALQQQISQIVQVLRRRRKSWFGW